MTPADIQDLYVDLAIELRRKTIKELRKIAAIQNIKGHSKMNKKKLLQALFDDPKWINEKLHEAEEEKGDQYADIENLYYDLRTELEQKPIKELRKIAAIQNIKGRSKMKKNKLFEKLMDDPKWINEKILEIEEKGGGQYADARREELAAPRLFQSLKRGQVETAWLGPFADRHVKKSSRKREKKQCLCTKQHTIKRGINKGIVKCDKRQPKGCHLKKTKKSKKSSRKRKKKQCTKHHTIKRGTNKGKIKCDKRNPKGCQLSK